METNSTSQTNLVNQKKSNSKSNSTSQSNSTTQSNSSTESNSANQKNTKNFDCLIKGCSQKFEDYFYYAKHLTSIHSLPINIMYLKFNTKTEFKNWKLKEEFLNNCLFSEISKRFYQCHRSSYILENVTENLDTKQNENERLFKVNKKFKIFNYKSN